MAEKGVSQKDLEKALGMSPVTFSRMRKCEFVSLETISRICEYLGCDYGDVISSELPEDSSPLVQDMVYQNAMEAIREALVEFMADKKLSASDLHELTGLSINTIKGLLAGRSISAKSFQKLLRLNPEFNTYIARQTELLPDDVQQYLRQKVC
jgi:DNA-binding Xre family transcriptional regulator